jgi:hypothetical protein
MAFFSDSKDDCTLTEAGRSDRSSETDTWTIWYRSIMRMQKMENALHSQVPEVNDSGISASLSVVANEYCPWMCEH